MSFRFGLLLGVAVVLLLVGAGPAVADPPGPTRYQGEVVRLEPEVAGVEAAVLGGDSFLQLKVEGAEVVVPGYDGEELYLRFDRDGTVFENQRSSTYFLNQDRYGVAEEPGVPTGPDVAPEWVEVSTDGTYAWHDHRIHWMSPSTLPFADTGGDARQVDPDTNEPQLTTVWADAIPIQVDGEEVGIVGELTYLPATSPGLALLGAAIVLALGLGALAWGLTEAGIGLATGIGVAAGLGVTVPQVVGVPPGVQGLAMPVVLPVAAGVVAVAGLTMRERSPFALVVAGTAGIPLLVLGLTQLDAITAPIVPPNTLPAGAVKVAIGLVLGGGLAALAAGIRSLFTDQP